MNNEEKNIENYLKSKVKQPGFSLPKDYFDNFESTLDTKIFEKSLPKNTGFVVPSNYFETLENEVLTKVSSNKKGTLVYLNTIKKIVPIAAIFVLAFILYNPFSKKNEDYQSLLSSIETTEIETYLINNTHKYSTADVVEVFENQLFNIQTVQESSIQTNALENYILENADAVDFDIY